MNHLFTPHGLKALKRLAIVPSVLVFDFDGTLAPLVKHFTSARVPEHTARQLMMLSNYWPVAVVTGRSVLDAKARLGFTPDYLYGNHGAECADRQVAVDLHERLTPCRVILQRHAAVFVNRKVCIEDKGLSLALHYRLSDDPDATRRWLHSLIDLLPGDLVVSDGHMVINVLLAGAPDKGDALLAVMQDCAADSALVVGDDDNDEAAFLKAPQQAVTVRITHQSISSHARYRLSAQSQLDILLNILLRQK